ncbi:XdhC family protein [Pantoea cypripedii]|uniref:XshC-Cox1 family protein n=1 Tax=Pantoea cypripedii TaxID=55209 RepID=A0A6B9GG14_PANCY|nr:XdhC family protein [Pantoea cypripedii]QGY32425.1 XshC-Cox1 family protein [Pantoea cypripedii]
MQNLDIQVLNEALNWAENQEIWLCTVLSTFGSSPRPPGTMMVIRHDGKLCGSLSGGCVEEDFLARMLRSEFSLASQVIRYGDGGLTPDRALPCGGVLDILVERLPKGEISIAYLMHMKEAISGALTLKKIIQLPGSCTYLQPCEYSSSTIAHYDDRQVHLTLAAAPRLIIAGLSVVAIFCANYAVSLGFETLVCENRPDALANFSTSLVSEVKIIEQFPASYLEKYSCHANTAIVSLTHDPRMDDLTMMEAVHTPAFYIGAMGSIKNSLRRRERLRGIAELTDVDLQRIHAPIGLQIASKTPAEIALSVMADIVRHKNGKSGDK